jgi:hypothetical protein
MGMTEVTISAFVLGCGLEHGDVAIYSEYSMEYSVVMKCREFYDHLRNYRVIGKSLCA